MLFSHKTPATMPSKTTWTTWTTGWPRVSGLSLTVESDTQTHLRLAIDDSCVRPRLLLSSIFKAVPPLLSFSSLFLVIVYSAVCNHYLLEIFFMERRKAHSTLHFFFFSFPVFLRFLCEWRLCTMQHVSIVKIYSGALEEWNVNSAYAWCRNDYNIVCDIHSVCQWSRDL